MIWAICTAFAITLAILGWALNWSLYHRAKKLEVRLTETRKANESMYNSACNMAAEIGKQKQRISELEAGELASLDRSPEPDAPKNLWDHLKE